MSLRTPAKLALAITWLVGTTLLGCSSSSEGGGTGGSSSGGSGGSLATGGGGAGGSGTGGVSSDGGAGGSAGSSGTGGGNAGTGGAGSEPGDAASETGGSIGEPDAGGAPGADAGMGPLTLTSTGFLMMDGDLVFPASASYPEDESPPFAWSHAPANTKSFALTFVDEDNGATKWVVWDIPASVMSLPGNLSKTVHPSEVPEATQRGSLGRTGYSGPGVAGPPYHTYQFVIWALDVEKLPGTDGKTTVEIRTTILPAHDIEASEPLVAKGQLGGP
jgi:Raf kinase inhibitor-like YbhB/YbcL family protein